MTVRPPTPDDAAAPPPRTRATIRHGTLFNTIGLDFRGYALSCAYAALFGAGVGVFVGVMHSGFSGVLPGIAIGAVAGVVIRHVPLLPAVLLKW